jgi:hypothetical protein
VRPLAKFPAKKNTVPHYFVSAADWSTKSRYGLVQEVNPFTLRDFVVRFCGGRGLSDSEEQHLAGMLQSIQKLPVDTPVAATYSRRGIDKRDLELSVHRVVFYKGA